MELISVVIPAYNCAGSIKACLESVLTQTYPSFEVIVVNDGSLDNTEEVVSRFLFKHSNLSYFKSENHGSSAARLYGVLQTRGKYICFVDSDDIPYPTYLEILYNGLIESKSDISIAQHDEVTNGNSHRFNMDVGVFSSTKYVEDLLMKKVPLAPWGKLFKRALLQGSVFEVPEHIKVGEDMIMNIRIASRASSIVYLPNSVYCYVTNSTSITKTYVRNIDHEVEYCNLTLNAVRESGLSVPASVLIKFKLAIVKNLIAHNLLSGRGLSWARSIVKEAEKYSDLSFKEQLVIQVVKNPAMRVISSFLLASKRRLHLS